MTSALVQNTLLPQALNDDLLYLEQHSQPAELAAYTINHFIQHLAEAVIVVRLDGTIEYGNAKAALLLNHVEQPLTGLCWTQFLLSRCQQQYEGLVKMVAKNVLSLQTGPTEMALSLANGEVKDIELSVSYLPNPAAKLVLVMRDLTKHKAECEKLRMLAATDSLTGLTNRRGFDEQLQKNWQECVSAKRPLSVILIDIDLFKQFNDTYGHIQGDACLRKVARGILQVMPLDAKLAARYGGEEFALIFPDYNKNKALHVAKEVQQVIQQLQFTDCGLPSHVGITVSQGIASEINGQYRTSTALLFAADTALYRAKSEGRDCIKTSC